MTGGAFDKLSTTTQTSQLSTSNFNTNLSELENSQQPYTTTHQQSNPQRGGNGSFLQGSETIAQSLEDSPSSSSSEFSLNGYDPATKECLLSQSEQTKQFYQRAGFAGLQGEYIPNMDALHSTSSTDSCMGVTENTTVEMIDNANTLDYGSQFF